MRIRPGSGSADLLMKHGVAQRELKAAHVFVFDAQFGAAVTLPFPILGPVILIKRKWLVYNDDDELKDAESIKILRHELCHVRQVLDWGSLAYLRRQIIARFKTMSLYAMTAPEESGCYWAQAQVEAYYRRLGEPQVPG